MRFAAIADIHGNDLALEAVLHDIAAQDVTQIVNLGDHLSGPLNAARTADILMAHNFPSILGNHDRYLTTLDPSAMGRSDKSAHDELSAAHLDWLKALPASRVYAGDVLMCHGTPGSDTTYFLEDLAPDGTLRLLDRDRIEALATDAPYPLILCAHTHIPRTVRLRDGRLIVNPGSVGCPAYDDDAPIAHKVETGTPAACYAILEGAGREWDVTFRQVPYDHMKMAHLAAARGREEWASALATGWIA